MITSLDLGGLLTAYSDRDISETLTPISEAGNTRRTINGQLRSIASPGFRKYSLAVSGRDLWSPAFDKLWPGDTLEIVPISTLTQYVRRPTYGWDGATVDVVLQRDAAEVVHVRDANGRPVEVISHNGNRVTVAAPAAGLHVSYRPRLVMLVTGWSVDEVEREASVSWSLDAAEV